MIRAAGLVSGKFVSSTTALIYLNRWYIFLIFLALATFIININIFLLMLNKLKNIFLDNNIKNNNTINLKNTKKIIQLLPCYNESKKEMLNTINSLCIQNNKYNVDKILLIICDGKINTHNILLDIFSNYITYFIVKNGIIYYIDNIIFVNWHY